MKIKDMSISFFIFFVIILNSTQTNGQFRSTPTKISTPRGNVTVQTLQYYPKYYSKNSGVVNPKYRLSIVLLNDSVLEEKVTLDISVFPNKIEYGKKENMTIIKPSETKEVFRMENGIKITGMAADSCWLFLISQNKINTYSIVPETTYPVVHYIQKGEDQILPLTKENLAEMVADNEKAMKLVEKGKLLKALEIYNKE